MREIKFRAWDKTKNEFLDSNDLNFVIHPHDGTVYHAGSYSNICDEYEWSMSDSPTDDLIVMQFTGLHDNSSQLKEIYEGDIIDAEGKLKGNIYESPQIYEEGTDYLIEGMGTETWRNTESVAVGRGCQYTKQ